MSQGLSETKAQILREKQMYLWAVVWTCQQRVEGCNHGNQGGWVAIQLPLGVTECGFFHLDGEEDTCCMKPFREGVRHQAKAWPPQGLMRAALP